MNIDLKGQKALVCGASKGIGRAVALELAELGAEVWILARNEKELCILAEEMVAVAEQATINGSSGSTALAGVSPGVPQVLALDVLNHKLLKEKIEQKIAERGAPNILVCNSGGPKGGPLVNASTAEFVEAFSQHLLVNHLLVQSLLPGMKAKGCGRIINIISTSVKAPIAGLGVSNTIRGAVASWAKTLANELGGFGITVNNVLPGFTNTDRLAGLKSARAQRLGVSEEQVHEEWLKSIPLGRLGEVADLAQAVAFLASPAGAYINGVNLPVDGGRTMSL